jgi:hypothetical protein
MHIQYIRPIYTQSKVQAPLQESKTVFIYMNDNIVKKIITKHHLGFRKAWASTKSEARHSSTLVQSGGRTKVSC